MPSHREVRENRCLQVFGTLLHDPNLWHLNRRSASGAFAVGLFVMYLPPVGQMIWAAAGAIWFRVNLPISVALVWLSNPVTIPPMFYFAYVVGCWITGKQVPPFEVQFWIDWHNWLGILGPLMLGCLVCASVCSLIGYFGMQALWRWNLMRQLRRRRERYAAAIAARTPSSSRKT
jgi:hypothetical protein